jgi:uncharacterized cupin superfamily protein
MEQEEIEIKKISSKEIQQLGITNWPIWEKEVSEFEWHYDYEEKFYLIEGDVTIKTKNKEYHIEPGSLVTCSKGLSCNWEIKEYVKKHYQFYQ